MQIIGQLATWGTMFVREFLAKGLVMGIISGIFVPAAIRAWATTKPPKRTSKSHGADGRSTCACQPCRRHRVPPVPPTLWPP